MAEHRNYGFMVVEDRYAGYTVYDQDGDKIGKVDDPFVDENDQPEYIGIKMEPARVRVRIGAFRFESAFLPVGRSTVDEERRTLARQGERQAR